jgi:outer membrane autotransporter protein
MFYDAVTCLSRLAPRSLSLLAGVSLAVLANGMAQAATYTASNQGELVAAIQQANMDGDASSTITMTGAFTITGSALPAVTKTLTIATNGNILTSAGPTTFNVGAGAALTVDGPLRVTGGAGVESTGGRVLKTGAGQLNFTGGPSSYAWYLAASEGDVVYSGGAVVTFNSNVSPTKSQSTGSSHVTVTGAGTVVTDTSNSLLGTAEGATLNVEDGARYVSTNAMDIGIATGSTATVNVTGDDTLLQSSVRTSRGIGYINVTEGGHIQAASGVFGGTSNANTVVGDSGGTAYVLVSGGDSRWDASDFIVMMRGSIDIEANGVVSTALMRLGTSTGTGTGNASISVSGEGSELNVTSTAANAFLVGTGAGTGARSGSVTINDGGKVTIGGGTGVLTLTTSATARGDLNIGAAVNEVAAKAGTLNAASVSFGSGLGVINFNHTDDAYGFDVALSGSGTLNQVAGRTVLTADQYAFTGKTNVMGGTLEVNGNLGGYVEVLGLGRLQGTGSVGEIWNLAGGTIAPGSSIGTLTINGDYYSAGGRLEIEAGLGDDSSAADLLLITGNAYLDMAPTLVSVINVGGLGAETVDGIKVIDVAGTTSDAGAFVLDGPAIGGAYVYELFQGTPTLADGDWYLRNTEILAPTMPTLENYPVAMLGMIDLPTLRQRVGDRTEAADAIWTRIEGNWGHQEASDSTTGASYDSSLYLAQVGLEFDLSGNEDGSLIAGLTAQYGQASASVTSAFGDGDNTTTSLGVGATITWRDASGTYVDLQGQLAAFLTDLDAAGYQLVEGNGGSGFAVSAEFGHTFALDEEWALTPQAQLSYASVDFDSFTDTFGSVVSLKGAESLVGRLGVAVDYETGWTDKSGQPGTTRLNAIGNLTYEFLDGTTVEVSGTDLSYAADRFGAELGIGGTVEWADGAIALNGELLASTSFEGSYGFKGTLGLTGRY